ncbi:lipid kinase [Marmoricola endophyticus]|uniref:Lipid kinase n=1 Tax=Marmoricola endophyticus TaxID=2040280 RepID=A0A917F1Q5_9ACTN|nr:lipid kinase [Marmoricola endophyticus]
MSLLVNGGARRGRGTLAAAHAALARSGLGEVTVHTVTEGADLAGTLHAITATAPDLLVVGGGDGTVSCAAGAVAGTRTTLGVLPLGTANDFARTLQIPSELDAAIRTLVEGKVVDVDLGRVDGATADSRARAYLNVASIGLSTGVTHALSPRAKRLLGPAAYPVATVRAFRRHRPFTACLSFPDGDHPDLEMTDLLQVAVGNGRHYGGGNAVSPVASLDDHLLDVYAIGRGRMRDHVSIARLFRDGRFVEHDRVVHVRTRRVQVLTDQPMPVNLDGEIAARTPASFTVERNAVRVVVPHASTAATLDGPPAP